MGGGVDLKKVKEIMEGKKYDGDKAKLYLLPPKSILEVGKVLTYGADKYDAENWRKVDDLQNRYTSAALRHIFAHIDGEADDQETGLSHLAHAMCCLLFKLEDELLGKSEEERPRETYTRQYPPYYRIVVSDEPDNEERSL
tara:strand:+ start:1191 stop:1613 length:423 start_codon:yes stop_codon:yes gene_type:complete